MVSIVAPPEIFSAYSFAVQPDGSEPDLQPGTHLRIYAGLGPSFPLAPFLVYGVWANETDTTFINATDEHGRPVEFPPQLGAHHFLDATLQLNDFDGYKTVLVELDESTASIGRAALLDQRGRTMALRTKGPWRFSAPVLHKLRVAGDGELAVLRRRIDPNTALELSGFTPLSVLGLPIKGEFDWYAGFQNHDEGMTRAQLGYPLRLNPMDTPFGPFHDVGEQDEAWRVEALHAAMALNATQDKSGIDVLIERLVNDPAPPWLQKDINDLPPALSGASQFVNSRRLSTLQMAAADPGMARYLGFADLIPELPAPQGGNWDTLAIIGLFALSPRDFVRVGVDVTALLHGPAPSGDTLFEQFIEGLTNATGLDQSDHLRRMARRLGENGFAAAPFVTFVPPVKPWLAPSLPESQIIQTRWQVSRDGAPSNQFRSTFAFPDMPLASLSALGRGEAGEWKTRHDPLGAPATDRAASGIFGHEAESNSRQHELQQKSKVQQTAGRLSDYDIPGDVGAVEFSARASDFFGRFGQETIFAVEPPPRPDPPQPVLRFHFEPDPQLDLQSDQLLSPGVLKVNVAVPRPWPEMVNRFSAADRKRLGSSIVVPRIDDLPPGALALATIAFGIGVLGDPIDATIVGVTPLEIAVPSLAPQESRIFTFVGCYTDTDGTASKLAEATFRITDPRPPKTYKTGVGLFWTSAPGPSPEVEVKLRWPAANGSQHRVYLTDQAALGLLEQPPAAERSRGLVAALGCRSVIDGHAADKRLFRLLTESPLTAGGGAATLEARLPRSLATVQFLRIVPLGPDGAEPDFDKCGIVPVAVPESRRPPAPRLDGKVDPQTGFATLTVSTNGFDRVALERDEPGLFNPGPQGMEAPRAFVRRAVGPVADPIYARASGDPRPMHFNAADGLFTAEMVDNNENSGLEPFVKYVFWAEVQLPPERRLPADFIEIRGDVVPVDPSAGQSHPRPKSLPSAPRVLMHVPPDPPAAPQANSVEITREAGAAPATVSLTIEITDPPKAHKLAADQYRLAIWVQWPGGAITPIAAANGAALLGKWPPMPGGVVTTIVEVPPGSDPNATLTLRLAFVDPVNRMSDLMTANVA